MNDQSSQGTTDGLFDQGIKRAQEHERKKSNGKQEQGGKTRKEQSTVTGENNVATSQASQVEETKKSLKDDLTAALSALRAVGGIRQQANDADECLRDLDFVKGFAEIVQLADRRGAQKLADAMSDQEAMEEWKKRGWDGQEKQLVAWANEGDNFVQKIVELFGKFNQNVLFRDPLRRVIDQFERPLREVNEMISLKDFLDGMSKKNEHDQDGPIQCIPGRSFDEAENVIILMDGVKMLYRPRRDSTGNVGPFARAGWLFVKETEARVIEAWKPMEKLMNEATPGMTPFRFSHPKCIEGGKVFIQLAPFEGVLIELFIDETIKKVRLLKAVGLDQKKLQQLNGKHSVQMWNYRFSSVLEPTTDLWFDISKVLSEWGRQEYQAIQDRVRERNAQFDQAESKIQQLEKIATLPGSPKDQGLTRLLNGEEGAVACFGTNFIWRNGETEEKGFFGVTIERRPEGLFLTEAVSDHLFDRSLIGQKLPLVVDAKVPSIKLENLGSQDPMRFKSLKMLEILLAKIRLPGERRFAQAETPTETLATNSQEEAPVAEESVE